MCVGISLAMEFGVGTSENGLRLVLDHSLVDHTTTPERTVGRKRDIIHLAGLAQSRNFAS